MITDLKAALEFYRMNAELFQALAVQYFLQEVRDAPVIVISTKEIRLWGKEKAPSCGLENPGTVISAKDLLFAFEKNGGTKLSKEQLARYICHIEPSCNFSSILNAVSEGGYMRYLLVEDAGGLLSLKRLGDK